MIVTARARTASRRVERGVEPREVGVAPQQRDGLERGGRAGPRDPAGSGRARPCPSRSPGAIGSPSKRSRTACHARSPTTRPPGGASDCIRLAVFTTSPATASPTCGPVPNATTASPVSTATRIDASGSTEARISSTCARSASPARTARAGSSSCATGAPNTPIAASPMNLSSVPPCVSIAAFAARWNGTSTRRTSSGSALSLRCVNPTRSANRIVTWRTSSADRRDVERRCRTTCRTGRHRGSSPRTRDRCDPRAECRGARASATANGPPWC